MLIFTRRQAQSFRIGDDITVTVIRIDRGQVSIGIDAPYDVPVNREEVWQRIQEENRRVIEVKECK